MTEFFAVEYIPPYSDEMERRARARWEARGPHPWTWDELASSFRAYLIGCEEDEETP